MAWKAIAAAAVMACVIAPANAWETGREAPHTMFFIKVPLDGRSAREQLPAWGFTVRTRSDLPAFTFDSRATQGFVQMGFVESKALLVGAVAAGAAIAALAGGGSGGQQQQLTQQQVQQRVAQQQAQQQAAQQQPKPPCPVRPAC